MMKKEKKQRPPMNPLAITASWEADPVDSLVVLREF